MATERYARNTSPLGSLLEVARQLVDFIQQLVDFVVKLLFFVIICLLPLAGTLHMQSKGNQWPMGLYLGMSIVALIMYSDDKRRAQVGEWRIPDDWLHAVEALCGWPGAYIAQHLYRHKISAATAPFRVTFHWIIVIHQVLWVVYFCQVPLPQPLSEAD